MRLPTVRRARILAAVLLGALLAGLSVAGGVLPAEAAVGTVHGTLTESGSGTPVAGVSVQAFCWQVAGSDPGELCGQTQTASDGTYSLPVAAGTYKVLFDHFPTHRVQYFGGGTTLSSPETADVVVPSGGSVNGISAALVRLRSVAGTVTSGGGPLGGINVTAYQSSGPTWTAVQGVLTGSDGTYALHLAAGTYRVGFADATGPYRTVFYGGADNAAGGADVLVAGADVTGVDAEMGVNHAITGRVTVDGVNMPAVAVTAWQQVSGSWVGVKVTQTGEDGRYALYLPDGTYRVEFRTWQGRFPTEYYAGASTLDAGTDVVLSGVDVPDVGATIVSADPEAGPAISGTLTVAGTGQPAAGAIAYAYRFNLLLPGWEMIKSAQAGDDGTYAMHVPEGSYRIEFFDLNQKYDHAFYGGGTSVDDAGDVLVPTEGVSGIDGALVPNHSISGSISVDQGPGLPPGTPPTIVTAWRYDDVVNEWGQVNSTLGDPDGGYTLYVGSGTYRIGFTPFSEQFLPAFYGGVDNVGEGTDVTLGASDLTGIDVHLVAASTDAGPLWSPPTTLSPAGQHAWNPALSVGTDGTATALWYRRDGSRTRIQATSRAASGAWSAPVNVSGAGIDASDPSVVQATDGRAVAVWRQWDGARYRVYAASRARNGTWSSPVNVSRAGGDAWEPQVVVTGKGTAVAVWRETAGVGSVVRASARGASRSWTAPVTLSRPGGDAWDAEVSAGPDNTIVAAWSRTDGSDYRVQVTDRRPNGTWRTPITVPPAGEDAWDPQLAAGACGRAAAVWRRSDGTVERVQVATRAGGGNWTVPITLSPAARNAHDPQVALHPEGGITAVWSRWDGTNDRVQATSLTTAGAWSAPVNVSRAGDSATGPQVAAGHGGNATLVWHQTGGFSEQVLTADRMPAGTWSAPNRLAQWGARTSAPALAAGPGGTAAAAWERRAGTDDRVQAVVRVDVPGPHCVTASGIDLNLLLGVPEQIVDADCTTVAARAHWRPVALWYTNFAFDAFPPGFIPVGATPLEDLAAKLKAVKVVVDAGTKRKHTYTFTPSEAARLDLTFGDYDPQSYSWPMLLTVPRMPALPVGTHTVQVIWTLTAQHCDGFYDVEAYSCLPSGDNPMSTRTITVVKP